MVKVLAFDFGASSGRAILATYENETLSYKEIHRFDNNPIVKNDTLFWDFDTLLAEIKSGIEKAGEFDSIGFDTWGVDFGLLDKDGNLLESPVHYRDKRTVGMPKKVFEKITDKELYTKTGNQIMELNTLFQVLAVKEQNPVLFEKAKTLLFMPDLFNYMLSGDKISEISIASTSQMLDLETGKWQSDILETFGLDKEMFLPPIASGTVTGTMGNAKMIAVAGHDTQCAIASIPSQEENIAFLSCGTWSLLGMEIDKPILTEQSFELNLSNEIGANGKINYLKNIIGLWLIQESRREWKRQGKEYSYGELEIIALDAKPLRSFVDPDSPEFGVSGDIPAKIQEYCRKTRQEVPETDSEIICCIYQSLAFKYRYVLEQLKEVAQKDFTTLHMLGGGTQAKLLCQMTSNSCGIPVIAGPIEATAIGNIMIQLVALGEIKDINEGRKLIAQTEKLLTYQPCDAQLWNAAYEKYKKIISL